MSNRIITLHDENGNQVSPSTGSIKTVTLNVSDWHQSGSVFTATKAVDWITANTNAVASLSMTASDEIFQEFGKCQIRVTNQDGQAGQNNGHIYFTAAKKPEHAIPYVFLILGTEAQ